MANDGNWYPPELHPSASNSEGSAASRLASEGQRDGGNVGPQFPDLFQAALQGNHLADNVSVKYDGDDERNVPVTVGVGASYATTSLQVGAKVTADGPVGEYTGATAAKRRWRRH
jgi:hypothetical protein